MQNITFALTDEHKTMDMLIGMLQLASRRFEDNNPLRLMNIEVEKGDEGEFILYLELDGKLKEFNYNEGDLKS